MQKLGEKHGMQLKLQNNNKKSYHIIYNLNSYQRRTFKKSDLPHEFIYVHTFNIKLTVCSILTHFLVQVERFAYSFNMKTEELINMSTRIDDILIEILKMTSKYYLNDSFLSHA